MTDRRVSGDGPDGGGPSRFYRAARELVTSRGSPREGEGEAEGTTRAAPRKLVAPALRAVRRRMPWSVGELYLTLGVALARAERFPEAAEAFESAVSEDATLELEVLSELASAATRARAADLAVRANLTLALRDTRQASRLVESTIGMIDTDIARQHGDWMTDDWYPAVSESVAGPAAMWCALLMARLALHQGDDELALRRLADARSADGSRAPAAAERVLGGDALPPPVSQAGERGREWMLARAFAAVGRVEDALNALEVTIATGGADRIVAMTFMAELLDDAGRRGDAAGALFLLGRELDMETRHEEAVSAYAGAAARDASNPSILWYLADSRRLAAARPRWPYADMEALAQARAEWERGVALAAPVAGQGWVHLTGALLTEALALVEDETGERLWYAALQAEQALAVDPCCVDAAALAARYHRSLLHPATTVLSADRAVVIDPSSSRAVVEQAAAHAQLLAPCLDSLIEAAGEHAPGRDAWLHSLRAWARLLVGDLDGARAGFDGVLEREASTTWALSGRALAAALAADDAAAATDAREVMVHGEPGGCSPGFDQRDQRALAAVILHRHEAAAELYEHLADSYWTDAVQARAGAACARLLTGDGETAVRWMVTFADLAGQPAQLHLAERLFELAARRAEGCDRELGEMRRLLTATGERLAGRSYDAAAAAAELEQARTGAAPGSTRWLVATAALARILTQVQHFADAAVLYEELMGHDDAITGFPSAGHGLAGALRSLSERADAATVAAAQGRLLELDATTAAQAALAVSAAHLRGGEMEAALAELERAIAAAAGAPTTRDRRDLHTQAGDILLALGRLAEAGTAYREALAAARAHGDAEEQAALVARHGLLAAAEKRLRDAAAHFHAALLTVESVSGKGASATALIAATADVLALADSPILDGALRGLTEERSLSPLQRRRLAAARFELLRRRGGPTAEDQVKPLLIEVADDLLPGGPDGAGQFEEAMAEMRLEILGATGVRVTGVRLQVSGLLSGGEYRLLLNEVPYGGGVPGGGTRLCLDAAGARNLGAAGKVLRHPFSGAEAMWLDETCLGLLDEHGLGLLGPFAGLAWHLGGLVRVHLGKFIGLAEIEYLLDEWESDGGAPAVKLVRQSLPDKSARVRLLLVMRALVRGHVPVDDLERILAALGAIEPRTPLGLVVEDVRTALRRSVSGVARGRQVIELPSVFEQAILDRIEAGGDPARGKLRDGLLEHVGRPAPGRVAVLVSREELRPVVQRMMETILPSAAVLSAPEFARERPLPPRQIVAASSESLA